jgi:hypothetical protein
MLRMARKRSDEHPVSETEDPRMGNAPRLTRRRLLTATAAAAALGLHRARAQTTTNPGCTLSFLNGLLHYSPDCALVAQPALGAEVAPPPHLLSLAQAVDGGTGSTGDKVPQRGSRRKRSTQRQHERRKLARARRHRHHKRHQHHAQHHDTQHHRHGSGGGSVDHDCADFATQQQAQHYFERKGYSASNDPEGLDADNDGLACEELP